MSATLVVVYLIGCAISAAGFCWYIARRSAADEEALGDPGIRGIHLARERRYVAALARGDWDEVNRLMGVTDEDRRP